MSAAVHMQQQQAALRAPGGAKPYSLFMMSPERVLGLKRAAEVSEMPISPRPLPRWRERDYTYAGSIRLVVSVSETRLLIEGGRH